MSGRAQPANGADSQWALERYARETMYTPELSTTTEPHWACTDCGAACYCTDELARRAPHVACGGTEEVVIP